MPATAANGKQKRNGAGPAPRAIPRIVGIGASAGGLEAFTELLQHLPTNAGVAYVLVQHLDPTHRSLLSELLGRVTSLPVQEIVDGSPVRPDQIYVIPPNCDLMVLDGTLKLSQREKNRGPSKTIDRFFKSLAEDQKESAIAVILSGAGSDGCQGIKAVKAEGGLTFAQDENSAKYSSMPRASAATGCVDFVLPPDKIAEEIARFIRKPQNTRNRAAANARKRGAIAVESSRVLSSNLARGMEWPALPTDVNLRKIFLLLKNRTSIDFGHYKINTIRRRMNRRMAAARLKTLEAYSRHLREHPSELEALHQDLLINVTSFFRNPSAFEALKRKVFPRMIANRNGAADSLRVWVAGCSTGQEAYSVLMAYHEFAEGAGAQTPIQVFATDVNSVVLDKARSGRYAAAQLDGLSAKRIKKFFLQENGHYRIRKELRDQVVFAQHNVLTDPPFTKVDLITCRNLLIYIEPALQQNIIPRFHHALKPDGYLWLGASESISQFPSLFRTVEKSHKIFSRKPAASWIPLSRPPLPVAKGRNGAIAGVRSPEFSLTDAQKEADRVLLNKYAPASVLVTEDMEILQFRGDVSPYLALPAGKASFNLMKMARDGMALSLQRLALRAIKSEKVQAEKKVRIAGREAVDLTAAPLKNLKLRCCLLLFEKSSSPGATGKSSREAKPASGTHLQQELADMREQLLSVQEEHDTAVEELQASNEEVQSTNEELQSLNEELETSNEELESANEELTTLNEELGTRNTELRESEQLLREQAQLLSMAPIVARSPKDRIIFWSGGAEKLYGFSQEDAVGQTSHLILTAHYFEPLEKIQAKLARQGRWEGEILHRRKDGRVLCIAAQWVAQMDSSGKILAVLEVHTDITARKEAEKALRASEEFNRTILENSPDCIKLLDAHARLRFMNTGGQKIMDVCDFKTVENTYWPGFWSGDGRAAAESAVRQALEGEPGRFQGFCPTARGTPKWWDVVVTPIPRPEGKADRLLCVSRDISEQKKEAALQEERMVLAAVRGDVALVLARAGESRPILQAVAEILARRLDVALARIWTVNPEEAVLELQGSAGESAQLAEEGGRIRNDDLNIGRIARLRRPYSTNDLQNDPELRNLEWARRESMKGFAGYPLLVAGNLAGVITLFSRRALPESVLSELAFVADGVAQFLHRQQSEAARSKAEEELNGYAVNLEKMVAERTASLRETIGELEAFSYSVSHDLRTPLRAMEGYARAVLEDCGSRLDDEHRGYMERIVRGARRLDQLTLDVLAYSRMSRSDVRPQAVDLNRLVGDIIDQYPQFASIRSSIEICEPLDPVMGHQAFLTQCVFNLLGNAVKFLPPDTPPKVKIWTEKKGGNVRLSVQDNGIGIAPEHRDRVFQIFGRINSDRQYEGTGIGLAIVKRAVSRMGGEAGFDSAPGQGSVFWIELPAAETASES